MNEQFKVRDRRGGDRYFIDNALLRGGWGNKLGPYGIAVYNALALHADADDQDAYPSYGTIARLTGMSKRQAMREIEKLEQLNIIRKKPQSDDSDRQTSNEYLLINRAEWIPISDSQSLACDSQSPPPVTHSHPPSDSQSPKQDPIKQHGEAHASRPPGLKSLLRERFLQVTQLPEPATKPDQKFWWGRFGELARIFAGYDDQAALAGLEKVIKYMEKEGLTVAGPESVVKLCRQFVAQEKKKSTFVGRNGQGLNQAQLEAYKKQRELDKQQVGV